MKAAFWKPDQFTRRKPYLEARQRVIAALRSYFAGEDFAEVETPALQIAPGGEVHLQAFATELKNPHQGAQKLYLHTSPEFAMKKLLAAGMPRIYQLAHCFRNGERSSLHHPEFLMLEWYRAVEENPSPLAGEVGRGGHQPGTNYGTKNQSSPSSRAPHPNPPREGEGICSVFAGVQQDCIELVRAAAQTAGQKVFSFNSIACNPFEDWDRISVAEGFARFADIDLLATAPDPRKPDAALLAKEAKRIGIRVDGKDSWDDLFFRIMGEKIEPHLGKQRPAILCDYPISMAALARPKADDSRLAERFEIYVCGVELANGFFELTDADEQKRRLQADMALKKKLYGETWPVDEDFIAALHHGMPDAAGVALGVDRLVMLCASAAHIEDVLWAPVFSEPR